MADKVTPTPQQIAADIIRSAFQNDAVAVQAADQIAAAIEEAGILIDPVDNGMWQNIKAGDMVSEYRDGGLFFRLTPQGIKKAEALINDATKEEN